MNNKYPKTQKIIQEVFSMKPQKPSVDYTDNQIYRIYFYGMYFYYPMERDLFPSKYIDVMYLYSKNIKNDNIVYCDIREPVLAISEKILNTPEDFGEFWENSSLVEHPLQGITRRVGYLGNVTDLKTGQEFHMDYQNIIYPSCFTSQENRLLYRLFQDLWVSYKRKVAEEKHRVLENNRLMERENLTKLYKDYIK